MGYFTLLRDFFNLFKFIFNLMSSTAIYRHKYSGTIGGGMHRKGHSCKPPSNQKKKKDELTNQTLRREINKEVFLRRQFCIAVEAEPFSSVFCLFLIAFNITTMSENTFPLHSADAIVNFYRTEVLTGQEAKHFTKSDLTPAPKVTSVQCY